jgi:4,5-dihydroxyphthalate decarboxylase
MHVVGVRKSLVEQQPWLPGALTKAFSAAKSMALEALSDTSATKVTLPFVEEQLKSARDSLGQDFWSYGVSGNEATIEAFLHHHHAQGLSGRRLKLDEIFHPSTYESFSV